MPIFYIYYFIYILYIYCIYIYYIYILYIYIYTKPLLLCLLKSEERTSKKKRWRNCSLLFLISYHLVILGNIKK